MSNEASLALSSDARKGFTKIPNWIFQFNMTSHELVVFVVLSHHLPRAYPSLERIAKMTGLSRSSVIRALSSLETKGLLIRIRGEFKTTHYKIRLKPPTDMEKLLNTIDQCQGDTPQCHTDTHQCHTDTPPVSQGHPNNIKNNINNKG
jgi:predicted transcriptional regulator